MAIAGCSGSSNVSQPTGSSNDKHGGSGSQNDTTKTGTSTQVSYNTIIIPANKSYIVPWDANTMDYNPNADSDNVTNWSSMSHDLVWYLHFNPGHYITQINVKISKNARTKFKLTVTSPNDKNFKQVSTATVNGNGQFCKTTFDTLAIDKKSFYRLELHPIKKTGTEVGIIKNLQFKTQKNFDKEYKKPRYAKFLSSPSVHLNFGPRDQKKRDYNWLYEVIEVPKGYDPIPTFYEALGIHRGYFGMQVNSPTQRRILFSIWDYGDADHERNIKPENKVTLVDKGKQVTEEPFGNEGAGKHAYWKYPWKTGKPIRFIANIRMHPSDNSAYLSAWFKEGNSKKWKYMATFRAPKYTTYFNGFYSFVEDFGGYHNGQKVRKAYFYNVWGKKVDGNWTNFNRATFSYTDGKPDSRSDYAGGVSSDNNHRFYLQTGGYTYPHAQKISVVPKENTPPDVDLDKLKNRIDSTLAQQIIPIEKSNWSVVSFDSQETEGEGDNNGRASDAIDDDADTYWHTQWYEASPDYPHYITLDLGAQQKVHGLIIQDRPKENGRPKEINVEVSDDNSSWTSVGTLDIPKDGGTVAFDQSYTFRYIKLTVQSGYYDGTEDVYFTHIAEIGLY